MLICKPDLPVVVFDIFIVILGKPLSFLLDMFPVFIGGMGIEVVNPYEHGL